MYSVLVRSICALALISGLLSSGFLHNAIVHTHDDSHGHESSVWASLHTAVRHDEKKAVPAPLQLPEQATMIALIGLILVMLHVRQEHRDPLRERFLSRGIARYRVFG